MPNIGEDSTFADLIENVILITSDDLDSDFFLYNSDITRSEVHRLIDLIRDKPQRKTNVSLILCTSGGDPDSAYKLTRFLKGSYIQFNLFIFGYCKSAGTLIALGADEIIMSDFAELGPLDIQLPKDDDLINGSTSGLDIHQSLEELNSQAFHIFANVFVKTLTAGDGSITTKTASEIASTISTNLLSPIASQIDPLRLGGVARSIKIAEEYGKRLNTQTPNAIKTLVSSYPSHSFVIDYDEALELFGQEIVRRPKDIEYLLEELLVSATRYPKDECILDLTEQFAQQDLEESQDISSHESDDNKEQYKGVNNEKLANHATNR